ncbi:MAG: cytochrome c [Myxococcota bacterium]|nr:cytochrome c [Myxococcota bacterium]
MSARAGLAALLASTAACSGDLSARPAARDAVSPIPRTTQSIAAGAVLYRDHCERCHGPTGLGNGPDALQVETGVGNLVERAAVLRPGSIAWKIQNGWNSMPAFPQLGEVEVWQLVHFVQTLAPGGGD